MTDDQLAELEILLASGIDVPTAFAAVQGEAPASSEAPQQTSARGAWLVGVLFGIAATLAASLFLGR